MITQDELKQLAQSHRHVETLSDILSTRYLNSILEERGQPIYLEQQSNERFYYYRIFKRKLNFTEEQRTYILSLLDYVNCENYID